MGVTVEGSKYAVNAYGAKPTPRQRVAADRLKRLFEAVEKNRPDQTLESKLVARLHLSTTVGEAVVILREVLGNGVLPAITVSELRALPAPQA